MNLREHIVGALAGVVIGVGTGLLYVGRFDDRVLQTMLIGGVIGAVFGKNLFTLRRNY